MRFETRTVGVFEVLSVHLEGEEVFDAGRLRQENLRLVEKGSRRIVVDLSGIDYLYSDSINAFVALNRRLLESSGRLGILVPHPKVHEILVRAGLENIMRLYRSEADLLGDSRELMRQSSAWTRPAELVNAASASQILTATNLVPRNSTDAAREMASATQRIQRRRSGPRVEVRPRRRGGRSLDQNDDDDIPLPPQLPSIGSESSSLRNLSMESSAFLNTPTEMDRKRVPPAAPSSPVAPPEAKIFELPKEPQQDGYSTDAWLLALSPPADRQATESPAPPAAHRAPAPVAPSAAGTQSNSRFDENLQWDAEAPPPPQAFVAPPAPPPPPTPPTFEAPSAWTPPVPPPGPGANLASAFLDPRQSLTPPVQPDPQEAIAQAIFHDHPSQSSRSSTRDSRGGDSFPSADSVGSRSGSDPWATERDSAVAQRPVPSPAWPPAPRSNPGSNPGASSGSKVSATAVPQRAHQEWIEAAERHDASKPAGSRFSQDSSPSQTIHDSFDSAAPATAWFEQPSRATKPVAPSQAPAARPAAPPAPVAAPPAPPRAAPPPPPAPAAELPAEDVALAAARASAWFEQPVVPRLPPQPTGRQTPLAPAQPKSVAPPAAKPVPAPKPAPVAKPKVIAPPPPPVAAPSTPLTPPEETSQAAARASAWFEQPVAHTPKPVPPPAPSAPPASSSPSKPSAPKPGPRTQLDPWQDPAQREAAASAWYERPPAQDAPVPVAAQTHVPEPPPPPATIARPSPSSDRLSADEWFSHSGRGNGRAPSAPVQPSPARPSNTRPSPSRSPSLPALEDSHAFEEEESSGKRSVWVAVAGGSLLVIGLLVWFLAFKKQSVELPLVPPETASDSVPVQEPVATTTPAEPKPAATVERPVAAPVKTTSTTPPSVRPTPEKNTSTKPTKPAVKPEPVAPVKVVAPVLPPEGDPVRVMISSRPMGAAIVVDGRPSGVTPSQIVLRRVGKVELNLAGFRPVAKQIDPDDNPGRVEFQLQPNDGANTNMGRIYLTSAPSGAEITVGGKNLGKTPRFVELPVGAQKLTLRSGPLAQTRTLEIRSGTNPSEHFGL